ncbi:hypothetical protein D2Q93_04540 [Alicyclobacillaceae bacterium I2511]|nr:hypothetical protein D2Q93_04540 [Alicyclobacillaceae bacterium I2511]
MDEFYILEINLKTTSKLSRYQVIVLLIWTITSTGLLVMPTGIGHFTTQDGWLVPIPFFLGACLSAAISQVFVRTFPGQSFTQAMESALGKGPGKVVNLWWAIWLYLFGCMIMRELNLFLETTVFHNIHLYLISAVMLLPLAYSTYLGFIATARIGELLLPIFTISMLFTIPVSFQNFDWNQLNPVLAEGISPVWQASVVPVFGIVVLMLMLLQFVPYLEHPQKIGRDFLIVGASLSAFGIIVEALVIGTLGDSVRYLQYPLLEIVRSVRIGDYLERLDTIYVMGIVAIIFIKLSFIQYTLLLSLKDLFHLPTIRHIALASLGAVWSGNIFLFRDSADLTQYMIFVAPVYVFFTLVVLPMAAIFVRIFRKILVLNCFR